MNSAARIEDVLVHAPDVVRDLTGAHAAAFEAVNGELLDICRTRIAQLLGCQWELDRSDLLVDVASWPAATCFSAAERACLALTEQWLIDVAGVTEAQIAAVSSELGEQGCVNFTSALLVIEQRQRLTLAWNELFKEIP